MPSSTNSWSRSRRAFIASLAAIPGCVLESALKRKLDYIPEPLGDGWEIAAAEEVGLDADALHAAYEAFFSPDRFISARSVLVVRHGKLVGEGYLRTLEDRSRLQHMKSATKSVTSLLAGVALERGLLTGLDARLGSVVDEAASTDKAGITLGDLLTMRTGIDWTNDVETRTLMVDEPESSVEFVLSRPVVAAPGAEFHYSDGNTHLLGAMVTRATQESLSDRLEREILGPLGVDLFRWERHRDGLEYGAYGLWMRLRDMARLGVLCQQRGAWNGEQLVPPAWIDESTAEIVVIDEFQSYGYQWWIDPGGAGFLAAGHGGQYIYVRPDLEMVVVVTALPYVVLEELGVVFEDIWTALADLVETAR